MRPGVVYKVRMRALVAVVALLTTAIGAGAAPPIAVLVVIDGLGATAAAPDRLPALAARATAPSSTWTTARGVLPARTNPNHASMLTGQWPDGHGIVGNRYWDAATGERVPMDQPRLLDAETLFDVLGAEAPPLPSAAFFAKGKLRRLFGDGPSHLWDPGTEYADDGATMRAAEALLQHGPPPALLVVAIADVDRASHRAGPGTPDASAAVRRADGLVRDLLDVLVARGLWERAVVIVTADHGFDTILPDGVIELPADTANGIAWVDEGRVALGRPVDADAPAAVPAAILGQPGVAGVRTDLARVGLAHPRAGAMLLLAAAGHAFTLDRAGYHLCGDHGGEEERAVPFIVVGGDPALRRLPPDVRPQLPDVAPTLAAILGVRDPRTRRSGVRRHGRRLPIWAPR